MSADTDQVDVGGASVTFHAFADCTTRRCRRPGLDVAAAVRAARVAARERGKVALAWWVPSACDAIVSELETAGLRNEDTPEFEAVVNALALVQAPPGEAPADVEVSVVETRESHDVGMRTMSRPICERMGFQFVDAVRIYVDNVE